jgi:TP901 family phage tail tape measure protein
MANLRGAVLTAGTAFIAATVGIQAFGRAVSSAAQLEQSLNVFRVTAGATADEMERVSDQAKALGRDLELPGVTAGDAAETFLLLSRAGLDVQESLDGARGTLQLATAAQISFAESAQLTASALNAFQLSGDQAITVADLLTNAANASQASITDMGIALRQSSAIASQVGFSVSETVTFLTQLAQAGLAGSDAGTSFRVAIQRLIAPTKEANAVLDRLVPNLRDASGALRPEAFFELADALERMGRAQADATRQVIFGNDASRAAAFFGRINAQQFREQERELNRQGAAAEVAAARNEGFAGSVENLKNQITALGIEIGELSIGPLGLAADGAALFFGALANQIADTREVLEGFEEDAEKLRVFLGESLEEGGFIEFMQSADREVNDFLDTLDRVTGADDFVDFFRRGGEEAERTAPPIRRLTEEARRNAEAIRDSARAWEVWTEVDVETAAQRFSSSIKRLTGQIAGLEEAVIRARISGDEGQELDFLEQERQRIERLIALQEEIVAEGGKGAATARARIRTELLPQLEGVTNEINRIREQQAANARNAAQDAQRAAEDAARAQQQADRDFLDILTSRRDDASRRAENAAATEGLADDIRAQDRIQALIKQQIAKVRAQVQDEKLRAQAVRELRIALIASRREEDALRAERAQQAAERRDEIQDLNIAIAQETGNDAALERAINARIKTLNKQIKAAKGDQLRVKQLKLERARLQNQLKDLNEQDRDTQDEGNRAARFFFEQLQAQQGFAANLLGNIIPRDMTSGLVGVPSPGTTGVGRGIAAAAAVQEGKAQIGPTAGQASTTNQLLDRILRAIIDLNRNADTPEAVQNKRAGSAVMDGIGGGSGSASVM